MENKKFLCEKVINNESITNSVFSHCVIYVVADKDATLLNNNVENSVINLVTKSGGTISHCNFIDCGPIQIGENGDITSVDTILEEIKEKIEELQRERIERESKNLSHRFDIIEDQ